MRKLLGVGFSSLLMITAFTSARAADLPVKAPPPVVPVCIWCGAYVGLNAGGSWGDIPSTFVQPTGAGLASTTVHPAGWIGGVQAGYNWQQLNWVFGVEGDIDARNASHTVFGLLPFAGDTVDLLNVTQTDSWLSTYRGRVGYAWGNVLLYGTGGVAVGEVDHTINKIHTPTAQAFALTDAVTRAGWTAGVGIEWMVWGSLSLGVQYLHVDLGNTTLVQPNTVVAGVTTFPPSSASFSNRSDIVRATLNLHLGQ